MAKKQRNVNLQDTDDINIQQDRTPIPKLINNFKCLCLDNIPGHPYRIGYHKSYIDLSDRPRCVYCNGLTMDWRIKKVSIPDESTRTKLVS